MFTNKQQNGIPDQQESNHDDYDADSYRADDPLNYM